MSACQSSLSHRDSRRNKFLYHSLTSLFEIHAKALLKVCPWQLPLLHKEIKHICMWLHIQYYSSLPCRNTCLYLGELLDIEKEFVPHKALPKIFSLWLWSTFKWQDQMAFTLIQLSYFTFHLLRRCVLTNIAFTISYLKFLSWFHDGFGI